MVLGKSGEVLEGKDAVKRCRASTLKPCSMKNNEKEAVIGCLRRREVKSVTAEINVSEVLRG